MCLCRPQDSDGVYIDKIRGRGIQGCFSGTAGNVLDCIEFEGGKGPVQADRCATEMMSIVFRYRVGIEG